MAVGVAGLVGRRVGSRPGVVAVARAGRDLWPALAVAAVQLVAFPVPVGVELQGLVLGALGALVAVALCLVYRLNGVVNFAQSGLGTAPAVLAYGLVGLSGVDYGLGLLTGLVGVVVLTVGAEVLVVRRFDRSPRLVLTVATIGLAQLLTVLSLLVPRIWGDTPITTAVVHVPWHLQLAVGPVVIGADSVVAAAVAVGALTAVAVWLRRSSLGVAVRAVADHRERAASVGIPVRRLQTTTWVVAAVLTYLAVFLQAAILGLPLDPSFGVEALVTALAALALGGFSPLVPVAVSAVAVGLLEQGVNYSHQTQPTLVFAVLAALVLAAVIARQFVGGDRERAPVGPPTTTLVGAVRDLPPAVAGRPLVRGGGLGGAGVVVAAAATVPLWLDPPDLLKLSSLTALAVVAASVVILTGWAGLVSLGQLSFAAVGAVVGAVALVDWRWDLSLALLVAAGAAGLAAAAVGVCSLRLQGLFVAVTTLAVSLAASGYLLDRAEFGWIPRAELSDVRLFAAVRIGSQTSLFELCLAVLVLTLVAGRNLRRSRTGRVLRALGAGDDGAAAYGARPWAGRLTAFAVAGALAGVGGCLLLLVNQQYLEAPFDVNQSLALFVATAVGGLGSLGGAVLGAALVEGSAVFLPPSWQLLPAAVGVLVVLLAYPGGLSAPLWQARDVVAGRLARWGQP